MAEELPNNITNNISELSHELSQKENNNEKTFTGTKIFMNSAEIDNSGKLIIK